MEFTHCDDANRGQCINWSKVIDGQASKLHNYHKKKSTSLIYISHIQSAWLGVKWMIPSSSLRLILHMLLPVGELGEDPLFSIPTTPIPTDPSPLPYFSGVGITEAPSVNFSIMDIHGQGVTKSNIWFSKSHSHLTDIITHTKLQCHLWNAKNDIISDIQQITSVMIILRNWENNDDEKIYWVAPTLDLPGPSPCSRVPQCLQGQLDVQS